MNIWVNLPFSVHVFISFGYTPSSRTAGSCGNFIFNFGGSSMLFSQWSYQFSILLTVHKVSISSLYLLSPVFLVMAIWTGTRWSLFVFLMCISLMTSDVNLGMSLLAFHTSSEKCQVLYAYLVGLFIFMLLSCMSSLYVLTTRCQIDGLQILLLACMLYFHFEGFFSYS